jgi:hypothetical protein
MMAESSFPYRWIRELGNDYIIIEVESSDGPDHFKIAYTVDENDNVHFGAETPIRQEWVEDDEDALTLSEQRGLADVLLVELTTPLDRVTRAAKKLS